MIYDQLAAERLFDPETPTRGVPAVSQRPPAAGIYDELAGPSWNGLRPEDRQYRQPPQDPRWRPRGDR